MFNQKLKQTEDLFELRDAEYKHNLYCTQQIKQKIHGSFNRCHD